MTADRLERLCRTYQRVAYRHLKARLAPDCCIAATRITIEVMRYFGFDARAVPVNVRVFNPAMAARLNSQDEQQVQLDRALMAGGDFFKHNPTLYSIGVGRLVTTGHQHAATPDGKWNGHLVAVVDKRWIIDAAIKQMERVGKGIILEDDVLAGPLHAEFLSDPSTALVASSESGVQMIYRHDPDNRGYKQAVDWKRNDAEFLALIASIITDMRAALEVHSEQAR